MTSLPRISVVTPSFNQVQFLEQTMDSVLSQGYPDLEYIVIGPANDASTTRTWLRRFLDANGFGGTRILTLDAF